MGDETLYATKGYLSVIRWADPTIDIDAYIIQRTLSVGGDTAVAGDIMGTEGETQGYVDVAAEGDTNILGVLLGPVAPADSYDLDDTIADGTTVNILRPTGGRTMISVILDSTATTSADAEEGDFARVGSGTGHVELFVYADTADSTDTMELVVGRFAEVIGNHTADDRVVALWY